MRVCACARILSLRVTTAYLLTRRREDMRGDRVRRARVLSVPHEREKGLDFWTRSWHTLDELGRSRFRVFGVALAVDEAGQWQLWGKMLCGFGREGGGATP